MGLLELFLIAVGLSMDAFAVAVCRGLKMPCLRWRQATVTALAFGVFQAGMPLLGWFLGKQFENYITSVDHWIAFVLLAFIGGKMVWEAFEKEEDEEGGDCKNGKKKRSALGELLILSVATSIDALAVGVTFAFLRVNIWFSIAMIGATTFVLSFLGVLIGRRFGARYKGKAELAGGVILILIGLKILLEHLGLISF